MIYNIFIRQDPFFVVWSIVSITYAINDLSKKYFVKIDPWMEKVYIPLNAKWYARMWFVRVVESYLTLKTFFALILDGNISFYSLLFF